MNDDTLELRIGCEYKIDGRDLVYAGMLNENVFSIIHQYNPRMDDGKAYNLYFPIKAKTFNLENSIFEILQVEPTYIQIRSLGRDKK